MFLGLLRWQDDLLLISIIIVSENYVLHQEDMAQYVSWDSDKIRKPTRNL
jgi:hypothetical protein